jgi:hypothetical protein
MKETIEWISVNDRVPDTRRRVLVAGAHLYLPGKSKLGVGFGRCNLARNGDADWGTEGGWLPWQVRFWAELPEVPVLNAAKHS